MLNAPLDSSYLGAEDEHILKFRSSTETPRCPSTTPSYHGSDLLTCELPGGHTGQHRTSGLFPNSWENLPEPMTKAEALLWLAWLEKDCRQQWWQPDGNPVPDDGPGSDHPDQCQCHGTGKVPALDLRELCPGCMRCKNRVHWDTPITYRLYICDGSGQLPKQERDALYRAMEKDGWGYSIHQTPRGYRQAGFYKDGLSPSLVRHDSDDWLAAVKALRAAGY